jgi:hypothetical protein
MISACRKSGQGSLVANPDDGSLAPVAAAAFQSLNNLSQSDNSAQSGQPINASDDSLQLTQWSKDAVPAMRVLR